MAMTQLDELRITIDDALGQARRIEAANATHEVSLVIVKLEEAFMWAERIGAGRDSRVSRVLAAYASFDLDPDQGHSIDA